jgi:hypothetical protein
LRPWNDAATLQPIVGKTRALTHKGNDNVPFLVELAEILRVSGDTRRANTVDKRINDVINEL